ncbi:MAG: helix-turn-helix domain-containing protein [Rikenellaceae bacterium]|nr:helix-turn-helix domain-containing protein [Rikenellaceae bacterium]MCL2692963.1 helix-turn-helix domain-containing protein [Rikenellaceae bacterium]
MEEFITRESDEFKELIGQIDMARRSVTTVRSKWRPTLADERYLSGDEVMKYLHISLRTLQTLRDNGIIGYTTIGGNRGLSSSLTGARNYSHAGEVCGGRLVKAKGGKILYPERELQKVLRDNYTPPEPPF